MVIRRTRSRSAELKQSCALLLANRPYGEADAVVQLFTQDYGVVHLVARGARKSMKRFGGALEPFHELQVEFEEASATDRLGLLKSAQVSLPRLGILRGLEQLQAAGASMSWLRQTMPPGNIDLAIWQAAAALLSGLSSLVPEALTGCEPGEGGALSARGLQAEFGVRLLEALGWGLELDACVICRAACPEDKSAGVSPRRGGVVCRACGGASPVLSGETRRRWMSQGQEPFTPDEAERVIRLVEEVFRVHLGIG